MATQNFNEELPRFKPVQVDTKYLCPKDPNYKKIMAAKGLVSTAEEAPTHLSGWFIDIKNVTKKYRTFNNGKEIEFENVHQAATWRCQHDGTEIQVDPYP